MTRVHHAAAAAGRATSARLQQRRLAVIGNGRLGQACAQALAGAVDLALAGMVAEAEEGAVPSGCVSHISELERVDAALLCLPANAVAQTAHELLQARVPVVECAGLDGAALLAHHERIAHWAAQYRVTAVVGAGWDAGVRVHLERLFALLIPKGDSRVRRHVAVGLHHTAVAEGLPGVRGALSAELPDPQGVLHRYVYVELEPGADAGTVCDRIAADPLFADESTQVLPVPDLSALEGEHEGFFLERLEHGAQGPHASLLLEARLDPTAATARIMVDAARAVPLVGRRAWRYTPFGLVPFDLDHEPGRMARRPHPA